MVKYGLLMMLVSVAMVCSAQRIPFAMSPIDLAPSVKIDEKLAGIWKLREDTNYHNYFVIEKDADYKYTVTYMDQGGDNAGVEHFGMYLSRVKNAVFMNVQYRDFGGTYMDGFVLLRMLSPLERNSVEMTAAVVSDVVVGRLAQPEIRKQLELNLNNPRYYSDTIHFIKKLPLNVCK
jgi:hypothetical protein